MSEYIYVLINPALKGLLKIGRTSRSPESRAAELSASTGVPTPFIVAYDERVQNSMLAESLIHVELSNIGHRLSDSREFFTIPLKDAIAVIRRVCNSLPVDDQAIEEIESDPLSEARHTPTKHLVKVI